MKLTNLLYLIWGVLFAFCAALGFIPEPEGFTKAIMVMLSVGFFVPGFMLLHQFTQTRDLAGLKLLRLLCILALSLDTLLVVVNMLSVGLSDSVGVVLHGMLVILGSPMVCSQYWIVVLFLWALLMSLAVSHIKALKE